MNMNKSPKIIKNNSSLRKKNPYAEILRTPMYKPRIKKSRKTLHSKNYVA